MVRSWIPAQPVRQSCSIVSVRTVLFLFEIMLGQRLPWMDDIVRAQRAVKDGPGGRHPEAGDVPFVAAADDKPTTNV